MVDKFELKVVTPDAADRKVVHGDWHARQAG
jgi:hypothetical protein